MNDLVAELFRRPRLTAVERASRAGGASDRPDRGTRHFLLLVAAIIIAGSLLVGFAWAERQYEYPTLFDSWENAYGVFDCQTESWLDPFETVDNPNGIRTRNDGVIYIEPSVESATGDNAQLGLFLENVGAFLDDDTFVLPDGTTLSEGSASCSNGEDPVLQVLRWDNPGADTTPTEIRTENLATTRFLGHREAIAIAFAPLGSIIAPPPSIAELAIPIENLPT